MDRRDFLRPDAKASIEQQVNKEGHDADFLFSRLGNPVIRGQIIGYLLEDTRTWAQREHHEFNEREVREKIEKDFDERLSQIQHDTPININGTEPSIYQGRELMPIPWDSWDNDGEYSVTKREKMIVEAHEKGHIIRPYRYREVINNAFDFEVAIHTDTEEVIELARIRKRFSWRTDDEPNRKHLEALKVQILGYMAQTTELLTFPT
ncbi:MAG: hypothetical protein AAB483_00045 [Patescibacteria group bacterium]